MQISFRSFCSVGGEGEYNMLVEKIIRCACMFSPLISLMSQAAYLSSPLSGEGGVPEGGY